MDQKMFQNYAAPDLLTQIANLLEECQVKQIRLPRRIRNLCDLTWEELSDTPSDADPLQPKEPGRPSHSQLVPDTHHRTSLATSTVSSESNTNSTAQVSNMKKKMATNVGKKIYSCCRYSLQTLRICRWAVRNKLGPILEQIEEEKARRKSSGHIHPLLTLDYKGTCIHQRKTPRQPYPGDILFPVVPRTIITSFKGLKLHYAHPDGTSCLYYPSGSVAVSQLPHEGAERGMYTNVFTENTREILATFRPNGCGFVYHPSKSRLICFALVVNSSACQLYNQEGHLTQEWAFCSKAQPQNEVNEFITLTISSHKSMSLTFQVLAENVTLCLRDGHSELKSGDFEKPSEKLTDDIEASHKSLQVIRERVRVTSLHWLQHYLIATGLSDDLDLVSPVSIGTLGDDFPPFTPVPGDPSCSGDEPCLFTTTHKSLRPKESCTVPSPKEGAFTGQRPPAHVPHKFLRRSVRRPVTCNADHSTPRAAVKQRRTFARLPLVPRSSAFHPAKIPPCPALLRLDLLRSYVGQPCRCSTLLPVLSDVELDLFISGPCASRGHLVVVYITSFVSPPPHSHEVMSVLQRMNHRQVYASSNPCAKSSQNPFRLVKYNTDTATRLTGNSVPALIQRHHVVPGTFLMYAGGRLVFGGSLLNGYGFSQANLLKQIAKSQLDFAKGNFLPMDYKLFHKQ